MSTRGVVTVANDTSLEWLLALLHSLRRTNPDLSVAVLPFNEDVSALTRRMHVLGVDIWRPKDAAGCRRLAATVHPGAPHKAGYFSRYAAFDGPFDQFLYLDADCLALGDLTPLFDAQSASGGLLLLDTSPGINWSSHASGDALRAGSAVEWSSGAWLAARDPAVLPSMKDVSKSLERTSLNAELNDQAFFAWWLHVTGYPTTHVADVCAFPSPWVGNEWVGRGWERRASETSAQAGEPVVLAHYAGHWRPSLAMPQARLWWRHRLLGATDLRDLIGVVKACARLAMGGLLRAGGLRRA